MSFTVAYWHIRGLASPIRLLLHYAGADWKNVAYTVTDSGDRSQWTNAKEGLAEENPLINLPYLQHKGRTIAQSNAILTYLGRELNLNGSDDDAIAKNDQILCQAMDLRNAAVGLFYRGIPFPDAAKQYISEGGPLHTNLNKFEKWLALHKTDFMADKAPTTGDFHVYEMLYQHLLLSPSCLDKYPNLKAYYERFSALPKVQEFEAGEYGKYPLNNKSAQWGSESKPPVSVE